jgi:hypothetical protein
MFEAEYGWLKLVKGTEVGYRLPKMSTLNVRKVGPFKVKRRVGKVASKLKMPAYLRMHQVIPCIHLEPASPQHLKRQIPPPPLIKKGKRDTFMDRSVRTTRTSTGDCRGF